jgi:hypothetical protein
MTSAVCVRISAKPAVLSADGITQTIVSDVRMNASDVQKNAVRWSLLVHPEHISPSSQLDRIDIIEKP